MWRQALLSSLRHQPVVDLEPRPGRLRSQGALPERRVAWKQAMNEIRDAPLRANQSAPLVSVPLGVACALTAPVPVARMAQAVSRTAMRERSSRQTA